MSSEKINWKINFWIVLEIFISTFVYYLIVLLLEETDFPFINNLFLGVIMVISLLVITYSLLIFIFIKIRLLITKEKLNIVKGILYLLGGAFVSLVIMNLLVEFGIIHSEFPLLLFTLIIMTLTILSFNHGLQIKKTKPNKV